MKQITIYPFVISISWDGDGFTFFCAEIFKGVHSGKYGLDLGFMNIHLMITKI